MRIGIISGTGGYNWPGLEGCESRPARNRYGEALLTAGRINGVDVVHLCRHGSGHARLSNQVDHRANIRSLIDAGVDAVLSTTVCGALIPSMRLGMLVVFDDLHFPSNRMPDGSLCTWHDTPGAEGRGHWIFDRPFSEDLRRALVDSAREGGVGVQETGCYGHVDGPRFNSRAEIAALAAAGVCAVSQTIGPEAVLAGEAELPFAVVGYLTDYANGVIPEPEPVSALTARIAEAPGVLAGVVAGALARVGRPKASGSVLRLQPPYTPGTTRAPHNPSPGRRVQTSCRAMPAGAGGRMLTGMHSRIVFIESKPGGLVIDALTADGRVLSMDAVIPPSMWGFASAVVLGRWAEQGTQVVTELYDKRGVRRLRLSDDEHLVVLDLSRPATVSAHAGEHLGKEGTNRRPGRVAAGRVVR